MSPYPELAEPRLEIDGRPATAQTLYPAMTSYAHFTAMQVRARRTPGLDLHLARLDDASRELFGIGLDGERVRELIRHALADDVEDASVRVRVFRPDARVARLSVLVSVHPPVPAPAGPVSLTAVDFQREFVHVKHAGSFGQVYHGLRAEAAGFGEALLTGPDGVIAEGSITNVGFLENDRVIWPDAPSLPGIAMLVLQRELDRTASGWCRRPVHLSELHRFQGAFVSNSQGVAPVSRIDGHRFDEQAAARVVALYHAAPRDPI
ncbi:aminotransferase class IV [Streptomyces sp. FH025]|uniref:aminotransferase class IV n=1 Tax=Streptomyces sp. FH025 TaxID=2815937 RepID=UPI001A9EE7C6|nr:aminotransferase class IV [Streptomyces sp. FH025]MBO1416458.1 aminotransferase class IV [Streptomyces sp. FH025]